MFIISGQRVEKTTKNLTTALRWLKPWPAELFQIIFDSFKAGIASAISSFK